jgi:hypothetical protein
VEAFMDEAKFRHKENIVVALRKEMENAEAKYLEAKRAYLLAKNTERELGRAHPDGGEAVRKAIRAEHVTRDEFVTAVVRFNRFVLDGKVPDDLA